MARSIIDQLSTILEYLDEALPGAALFRQSTSRRPGTGMRAWLRYIEEKPTPAVRYPTFNRILICNYQDLSDDDFNTQAEIRPLKTDFYKQMGRDGFDDDATI